MSEKLQIINKYHIMVANYNVHINWIGLHGLVNIFDLHIHRFLFSDLYNV